MKSFIVVNHNDLRLLPGCLESIYRSAPGSEVMVVDTESTDGSVDLVRRDFPAVQVVPTVNLGYPRAVNVGLSHAQGDVLVPMNSDLVLNPQVVQAMEAVLKWPKVGIVGPVLRFPNGRLQPNGGLLWAPNRWFLSRPRAVSWLCGAVLMTSRKLYQTIGGLDPNFGFYNDDIDWCFRARRAGFRVILVPQWAVHYGGASTPDDPEWFFEGVRGGVYLALKHYPPWAAGLYRKAVAATGWWGERFGPPKKHAAYAKIRRLGAGPVPGPDDWRLFQVRR